MPVGRRAIERTGLGARGHIVNVPLDPSETESAAVARVGFS